MINRLAVGFWKACLCQFAWWGRNFKVGLAFIACRRGTEGGSHPGLELSAPWSIRIAKRGSGGELQTSGFWCWCLQAAAMASATVTKMLYPMSCDGLNHSSAGKGCLMTSQKVLRRSSITMTFCVPGALHTLSEVGARTGCWSCSLFPFTSSVCRKTP